MLVEQIAPVVEQRVGLAAMVAVVAAGLPEEEGPGLRKMVIDEPHGLVVAVQVAVQVLGTGLGTRQVWQRRVGYPAGRGAQCRQGQGEKDGRVQQTADADRAKAHPLPPSRFFAPLRMTGDEGCCEQRCEERKKRE